MSVMLGSLEKAGSAAHAALLYRYGDDAASTWRNHGPSRGRGVRKPHRPHPAMSAAAMPACMLVQRTGRWSPPPAEAASSFRQGSQRLNGGGVGTRVREGSKPSCGSRQRARSRNTYRARARAPSPPAGGVVVRPLSPVAGWPHELRSRKLKSTTTTCERCATPGARVRTRTPGESRTLPARPPAPLAVAVYLACGHEKPEEVSHGSPLISFR